MAGVGGGAGRPRTASVGRRDVLRVAALAAVGSALTTAGCDIRLQDDAPSIPLLQRKSVPDEAALVDAVRRTTDLGQQAGRVPDPSATVSRLATLHQTQSSVLRGRLVAAGVPNHVLDDRPPAAGAAATAGPTATAAVSAPPATTVADLTAGETATVAAMLPTLPAATAANRPVLVSVAAACASAVEDLGATVTWPATDPLPPGAAVTLLADTRAAGYAFQIVAAQTSGDQRARALRTHTELDAREADLAGMAGSGAPPAPLGYALPFPVDSPDAAVRLATSVLTALVAGGLAPLGGLADGSSSVLTLTRFLVGSARSGRAWGVEPVPFPGLAYP